MWAGLDLGGSQVGSIRIHLFNLHWSVYFLNNLDGPPPRPSAKAPSSTNLAPLHSGFKDMASPVHVLEGMICSDNAEIAKLVKRIEGLEASN